MKAQAEWTARTEGPVVAYSASKRDKVIGIGLSAKQQGQRSYQTALTGRRHDCTRPAKLKHRRNHLAKRAPSRHDATATTYPIASASIIGGISLNMIDDSHRQSNRGYNWDQLASRHSYAQGGHKHDHQLYYYEVIPSDKELLWPPPSKSTTP